MIFDYILNFLREERSLIKCFIIFFQSVITSFTGPN